MTVPYPEVEPLPQLTEEEVDDILTDIENRDLTYVQHLLYNNIIYLNPDRTQLRELLATLSTLSHGQMNGETLTAMVVLKLQLEQYDEAFQLVEYLFSRRHPDGGYAAYCTLRHCPEEWLQSKGLEYLIRAARAGHVLAEHTRILLKYKKYGRLQKLFSFRERWRLLRRFVKMSSDDPLQQGYREGMFLCYI